MQTPAPLSLRPLPDLIRRACERGLDGVVHVRDRDGGHHRVTIRSGRIVAVHVEGMFDPLLDRLRRTGALDGGAWLLTLEALGRSERPTGQLAMEIGGLDWSTVRGALEAQQCHRFVALVDRARRRGTKAWLEARLVMTAEQVVPLSATVLLARARARHRHLPDGPETSRGERPPDRRPEPRGSKPVRPPPDPRAPDPSQSDRRAARRNLRQLAFALHPDRHRHLDPEARRRLAERLATATARHHRLS